MLPDKCEQWESLCVAGPSFFDRLVLAFCREVPSSSAGQLSGALPAPRACKFSALAIDSPLSFFRLCHQPSLYFCHPSCSCYGYFLELFSCLLWPRPLSQWPPLRRQLFLTFHCCCQPMALQFCLGNNADRCLAVFAAWPANHSMLPLLQQLLLATTSVAVCAGFSAVTAWLLQL